MNKLTFRLMNYGVNKTLDIIINTLLDNYTIINHTTDGYISTVRFNNGSEISYWDANKWYAWMNRGNITHTKAGDFNWCDSRPKRKTMLRFDKAIQKYYIELLTK